MLNIHRPTDVGTKKPLNALQAFLTGNQSSVLDANNSIVGCESAKPEDFEALDTAHSSIVTMIESHSELGLLDDKAKDAMAQAIMVIADSGKLKSAMSGHIPDVGNEAFDSDSIVNTMHLTVGVAGELATSVTDADFIFPKVVVDQKTTQYALKATRTVIEPKFHHAKDDALTDWGKLNLINASVQSNMLRKDLNKLVPELTAERTAHFVSEDYVTPWNFTREDGKVVKTSFLSGAEDINLITLSTAKGMDRNSTATILDRIDEGSRIRGIVLGVGNPDDHNAVWLNTLTANHSTFTKSQTESDANVRQVAFNSTTMMLNLVSYDEHPEAKLPAINDIPELKALVDAGYTKIGFKVQNSYSLNLSSGTMSCSKASPVLVHIEKADAKGVNVLESAKAESKALLDAVKPIFLCHDFDGTLSNKTLRITGDRLGAQDLEKLYALQARTPVEILTDVLSEHDDADGIKMLSQALMLRRDDESVAELHKWFNWAEANLGYEGVADSARQDLDIIGLHYLQKPYVKRVPIKLQDLLKEEDTTTKLEVLEKGLTAKMQDELVLMFQESNYRNAVRAYGSDPKHVPEVALYGDSRLTSYIMRTGEDRTFGDGSVMQEKPDIQATDRDTMRNVIYAWPKAKSMENEKDRIFGFAHSIEITPIVVKRARDNGSVHDQVQIWPVYENIVTMPLMIRYEVEGLDKYFSEASADKVISK